MLRLLQLQYQKNLWSKTYGVQGYETEARRLWESAKGLSQMEYNTVAFYVSAGIVLTLSWWQGMSACNIMCRGIIWLRFTGSRRDVCLNKGNSRGIRAANMKHVICEFGWQHWQEYSLSPLSLVWVSSFLPGKVSGGGELRGSPADGGFQGH